jgi:hypothetical protein
MGNLYGTKPEETECLGCMQPNPAKKIVGFCRICAIRNCAKSKGFYSCHQCEEWPCSRIENFGFATGLRVMKKTIPLWRAKVAEHGDEKGSVEWARAECEPLQGDKAGSRPKSYRFASESTISFFKASNSSRKPHFSINQFVFRSVSIFLNKFFSTSGRISRICLVPRSSEANVRATS